MANNYQQHSFMIEELTPTEVTWLETKFDEIDKGNENDEGEYVDIGSMEIERYDSSGEDTGEGEEYSRNGLWLYAEEGCDLDSLVDLLQDFLKENRPDSYLSFEWANTCSKMRLDEFSGGAVFITADKADWVSTYDFLKTKRKEFEAAK